MNWYKNLKIAPKLILGFIVVAVIAAVVGVVGLFNIREINAESTLLFNENTLGIAYSGDAYGNFERLRFNTLKLIVVNTEEEREVCIDRVYELSDKVDDLLSKYKAKIDANELAEFEKLYANWEEFKGYMLKVVEYQKAGRYKEAEDILLVDSKDLGDNLREEFVALMKDNAADADQRAQQNNALSKTASITMVVVVGVGVIIAIVLGIYIAGLISTPIKRGVQAADLIALGDVNSVVIHSEAKDEIGQLAESFKKMTDNIRNQALAAERIAAGDLTVEVPVSSPNDLLGNTLALMVKKNNEVLSNIYVASEQVAVGAKQVSDSSILLSEGATEQASAIEELTASIEEISSQTELNAENANEANKLAEEAKLNAKQGNAQMQEMLKAMDEINEASTNISKVIKVIDDIAFQTNILALNAAVEAARAGQHGKGFAVVAEEVRNLAARSANAAKETTDMIEGSIKKSEGGTKIAKDTAQALDEIVRGIEKVANLINGIANASNEQSLGIKQINQGIMQVSQVVQSNSATSEEGAAASEELSSQAAMLKETVNQFKIKKMNHANDKYENLSPDVIKMLENISATGNGNTETKAEVMTSSKPQIVLSDMEFGKY